MKIRLMGSEDIVAAWAEVFRARLSDGASVSPIYPNRRGGGGRVYIEIDDRVAEQMAQAVHETVPTKTPSLGDPSTTNEPCKPVRQEHDPRRDS